MQKWDNDNEDDYNDDIDNNGIDNEKTMIMMKKTFTTMITMRKVGNWRKVEREIVPGRDSQLSN